MSLLRFSLYFALTSLLSVSVRAQITGFYLNSTPGSAGNGLVEQITPADGFNFQFSAGGTPSSPASSLTLIIKESLSRPDYDPLVGRIVDFTTPHFSPFAIGHYTPLSFAGDYNRPGFDFWIDGRTANTVSGYFDVLEAVYDQGGKLISFAVDFYEVEYVPTQSSLYAYGSVRMNSTIALPGVATPVPESSSVASAVGLLSGLVLLRQIRRRRRSQISR